MTYSDLFFLNRARGSFDVNIQWRILIVAANEIYLFPVIIMSSGMKSKVSIISYFLAALLEKVSHSRPPTPLPQSPCHPPWVLLGSIQSQSIVSWDGFYPRIIFFNAGVRDFSQIRVYIWRIQPPIIISVHASLSPSAGWQSFISIGKRAEIVKRRNLIPDYKQRLD